MKTVNIFIIFFLFAFVSNGQITNEGNPKSWALNNMKSLSPIAMPKFDLDKIKREDQLNDQNLTKPWRFGYDFDVDLGLYSSGLWEELNNGDGIWRINIVSSGAKTLNFVFDSYKLPEGATIYLYNESRSFKLGAYTNKMNNDNESLGTWLADGESIFIEYYEPANVRGQGKLNIGKVIHGYRTVTKYRVHEKGLNDSGDCNLDVNCSIGTDFDPIKDRLRKSVGLMITGDSGFCSGALINNTSHDRKPLFLTANHCGDGDNWAFRFNWISTNSVCASTDDSTSNGPSNYFQTTSGSRSLANNENSDFNLIEITGGLDSSWDLEWAGWNRTGNTPDFVVGIHHPRGDIMKVCRDDSELDKIILRDVKSWHINEEGNGWELGVTEGGSSGSPLFDQDGSIIGQLFAGAAACDEITDNDQDDFYGRFDISWDAEGNGTPSNSLSSWLDPIGTGEVIIPMLSNTLSTNDYELENSISIFPNPSNGIVNIINKSDKRLTYKLFNTLGQEVIKGEILNKKNPVNVPAFKEGVYFLRISESNTSVTLTKKLIFKN